MFLNNWWNYTAVLNTLQPTASDRNTDFHVFDKTGTAASAMLTGVTYTSGQWYDRVCSNMTPYYGMSIAVGSGTTPVTAADVALDQDVSSSISQLSTTSISTAVSSQNNVYLLVSGYNMTNASIIINEIGMYKWLYASNGYVDDREILFVRIVLDNAVTVAPGEGFAIPFLWTTK